MSDFRFIIGEVEEEKLDIADWVTAWLGEEGQRFRIFYWGGTVFAQAVHEDLCANGLPIPVDYGSRPDAITKLRADRESWNLWAPLVFYPEELARWFGKWRYEKYGVVTTLFVVVTQDEYGLEYGRAEGEFK